MTSFAPTGYFCSCIFDQIVAADDPDREAKLMFASAEHQQLHLQQQHTADYLDVSQQHEQELSQQSHLLNKAWFHFVKNKKE